jgi:hypothetical protein
MERRPVFLMDNENIAEAASAMFFHLYKVVLFGARRFRALDGSLFAAKTVNGLWDFPSFACGSRVPPRKNNNKKRRFLL